MAAKEPLLQEDDDVSFESVSIVLVQKKNLMKLHKLVLADFVTFFCTRFIIASLV